MKQNSTIIKESGLVYDIDAKFKRDLFDDMASHSNSKHRYYYAFFTYLLIESGKINEFIKQARTQPAKKVKYEAS